MAVVEEQDLMALVLHWVVLVLVEMVPMADNQERTAQPIQVPAVEAAVALVMVEQVQMVF